MTTETIDASDAQPVDEAKTLVEIRDLLRELVAGQVALIEAVQKLAEESHPIINAKEYAALLRLKGASTIYERNRRGLLPECVLIGVNAGSGDMRWDRAEVLAHFRAGMPGRDKWKAMRQRFLRRSA